MIFGHKICQTSEAKWLRIDDIYQKLYRPNPYDFGGTYDGERNEYWFSYRTEQIGSSFLMHLFVGNPSENSVTIALSLNSEITLQNKSGIAFLSPWLKSYAICHEDDGYETYITTYHFTEQDVESLVDKKLYIPIRILHSNSINNVDVKARHDFRALLQNPIGADFTIESMEGEKFKFHKTVLSVQSEVFKAMLRGDTAENQSNFVALNDVAKEDLQCIRQYVYTGAVTDQANWANLLVLADRYDLCGLKLLAEHWLILEMTLDNAVETLLIGDTYNSSFLKQEALKFIRKHPATIKSADFKEVQNPELFKELCLTLAAS